MLCSPLPPPSPYLAVPPAPALLPPPSPSPRLPHRTTPTASSSSSTNSNSDTSNNGDYPGIAGIPLPESNRLFLTECLDCAFVTVEGGVSTAAAAATGAASTSTSTPTSSPGKPGTTPQRVLHFSVKKAPGYASSSSTSENVRVEPHFEEVGGPKDMYALALQQFIRGKGVKVPGGKGSLLLPSYRTTALSDGKAFSSKAGFACLGVTDKLPQGSLPILADELPVGPYSTKGSTVLVRDWRGGGAGGGAAFFKATVTTPSLKGFNSIMEVREEGSTSASGVHAVHRSRVLLASPTPQKDVRGSRVNAPGQLEVVSAVVRGGGEGGALWTVKWRTGVASTMTTVENAGVVWHLKAPGGGGGGASRPLVDRVEGTPWNFK